MKTSDKGIPIRLIEALAKSDLRDVPMRKILCAMEEIEREKNEHTENKSDNQHD